MKKTGIFGGLLVFVILLGVGYYFYGQSVLPGDKVRDDKVEVLVDEKDNELIEDSEESEEVEKDTKMEVMEDDEFKEDGSFASDEDMGVDMKELEKQNKARLSRGCFAGKDCIPSIDNPKFVSASEAERDFLDVEEWVIGLERNGVVRAYPLSILNWHEIVNDKVGDEYIAISFCPLCYTGNAFERIVDGEPSEFGVSGYLINSNLVMYDRNTDSLWEQLTGEAIVGPQIGKKLKKITVSTMPWSDWKDLHPDTVVLSTDTGYDRDYGQFPYGDYNTSSSVFFDLENKDDRLFEKELIYGVTVFDKAKAYPISKLEEDFPEGGEFKDSVGGHSVNVKFADGNFAVYDAETDEEIVPEIGFWFSWAAFYPKIEIYGQ